MGLSIYQSQPDPRLGSDETSLKLAQRASEGGAAGADGGDDFIGTESCAGAQ